MSEAQISQMIITIVVVCLYMWRISYGYNNGLFAEAAGLIAVIAASVSVYYIINIAGGIATSRFGAVIPRIGYLVVAFAIYKIMTAAADAFRRVRSIPIIGGIDRLLGAVLGVVEASGIILFIEYVTDLKIFSTVITSFYIAVRYIMDLKIKLG